MMFEAYKVAVRVSMIDKVSPVLAHVSRGFAKTNKDATHLQKTLDRIKLMGAGGAAVGGLGFMGLGVMAKMVKPAEDYAHQLNIINMAGWKHQEQVAAIASAWKNTQTVMTSTATENLHNLLDLKNVLGNLTEAREMLPYASKLHAVLAASSDGKSVASVKDIGYAAMRALDAINAVHDKTEMMKQAGMMGRAVIATQGRVTPEMFKSFFVYSRQAAASLNDTYKYTLAPTLLQELATGSGGGGGSKGLGPAQAALYRVTNQGYINKKALPLLEKLGLVDPHSALKTTTQGTTIGHFKGWQLAAENPFEWATKVFEPAVKRAYGQNVSKVVMNDVINQAFRGNQGAAWIVSQFINKQQNFLRDQKNILEARSVNDAYVLALSHDPRTAEMALGAQWANFKTALTMTVVPTVIPALMELTHGLNNLASFFRKHPTLGKDVSWGVIGLSGAMAVGGTLITTMAGFKALFLMARFIKPANLTGAAVAMENMSTSAGRLRTGLVPLAAAFGAASFGVEQAYKAITTGNSDVYNWYSKFGQWMTGDKNWTLGGSFYDMTHKAYNPNAVPKQLFPHLGGQHGNQFHWQHPASAADVQKALHVDVHVDGKKVARAVFDHAGNAASGPMSGTSVINGASLLPPPNVRGAW